MLVASVALTFMVSVGALGERALSFDAYPAVVEAPEVPAQPNIKSHPEAPAVEDQLLKAAAAGPNFAGSFAIVRLPCGTSCARIALVDLRDGSVYFPPGLRVVHWSGWWHEPYGPVYRTNSRLLVVYGQANSEEAEYGVSSFEWTGSDFKLIAFAKRHRGSPPE